LRSRNPLRGLASLTAGVASPLHHVRAKIIMPYAILCVILAVVGTYLVTQLVAGSLRERFDNQLAEAGRVAADAVVRDEQNQLKVARAMAFTEGVPQAVIEGNATRLKDLVSPLATNERVDRAVVVDATGKLVMDVANGEPPATDQPAATPSDPSQWGVVQQVLAGGDALGDKYASLVQANDGFYLFTAAPLTAEGLTVGAVLVGTRLDSLVGVVKSQALADVTFYSYDGRPLASSFVLAQDGSEETDLALSPTLASDALNMLDSSPRDSRSLFGRNYDFAYGRLTVRQSAVGLYSVSLPTNFILSAGATTRTNMSILFGAVISAVLIIGYLVAQRITNPISRLANAARSVAAGDLKTRSGVRSSDEIGSLARSFDQMTESLGEHAEQLRQHHVNTIKAVTSAVDARDPCTMGHSLRVGRLAAMLGRQLGLPEEVTDEIEIGGYLHDIGKIGVKDTVLLKPGPLTTEERVGIDTHPMVACRILESLELSTEVREFVRSHHERLDGSGYPDGLRGQELSLVARIAAVADMYDAMTSTRPYKAALAPETALADLKSQAGTLLDADVVAALEAVLPEWERQRNSDAALRGLETVEPGERDASQAAA
jgi:putative nucleotidyltransferase with HDIG domain